MTIYSLSFYLKLYSSKGYLYSLSPIPTLLLSWTMPTKLSPHHFSKTTHVPMTLLLLTLINPQSSPYLTFSNIWHHDCFLLLEALYVASRASHFSVPLLLLGLLTDLFWKKSPKVLSLDFTFSWWSVLLVSFSFIDFPGGSAGKASTYNAGDLGSIPGSGRSPGEGNGNPLKHSCLENSMDGGTW